MNSSYLPSHHSKLKIGLVTDWYLPRMGGTELSVHQLAKELRSRGHEAQIVTTIPGPTLVEGVPVHRIKTRLFPKLHFAASLGVFKQLRSLFEKENFDVLHCHGSFVPPVASGSVIIGNKMGLPVVCTIRSLLGPYKYILKATDFFMKWSSWPVVYSGNCEKVASELRQWIEPSKIQVLHNGLNPQDWQVTPKVHQDNILQITSIMRLTKRKRPADFLKIMDRVQKKLPLHQEIKVLLIGDGPERPKLERLIKRLGLSRIVEITGFINKEKIKQIFAASHIYVQPTIVEAFGNAALEARAAGLPVIARVEGGIKEFVLDGEEGFIVSDDEGMVDRICSLILHPDQLQRISEYNRQNPPATSWSQVIEHHLNIYQKAMGLAYTKKLSLSQNSPTLPATQPQAVPVKKFWRFRR